MEKVHELFNFSISRVYHVFSIKVWLKILFFAPKIAKSKKSEQDFHKSGKVDLVRKNLEILIKTTRKN